MNKILMYHSIGGGGSSEVGAELYGVSVEKFREQMDYLAHSSQLTAHSQIIITLDDGLLTNYTNALPILKEFGLKVYFFILVGKVGAGGYMNWEQIRQLKDAGMVIGSHGMTHRFLTELKDKDLDYELRESKKILEDNLGCAVDYFSVPRGFCDERVIGKAKKVGYKAVFTSNPKDNDGFKFGRIPVKSDWEFKYFCKVLSNGLSTSDRLKESFKSCSKNILGAKKYDWLRTKILKLNTINSEL